MSLRQKLSAWYHRCRTCDVDGIEGSLLDRVPHLQPVEALKFGQLYRCSRCGGSWFLHEHKRWLHRIADDRLPLVRRWSRERLEVAEPILDTLAKIGGVPDFYAGYIAVPCSVRDTSEEHHERSTLLISKQPPLRWPAPPEVHWAQEIAAVSVSPFALPFDVRRASAEQREQAMGFAPVGVVDDEGTEYTLGAESRFFDSNGVKGSELRLSGRQKKWQNVVSPLPAHAYFFVDWFDTCRERLVPTESK